MKDKDTILLEEAYTNIREGLFDKIGNPKMHAIAPILKTNPVKYDRLAAIQKALLAAKDDTELEYDVFADEGWVALNTQTGDYQIEDLDQVYKQQLVDYIESNRDKILTQKDAGEYEIYLFASIYGKKKNIQRYVQEYLKSEIIVLVPDDEY